MVAAMVAAEVPVMAHLGLTPQSVHRLGGFKVQGREEAAREAILAAALTIEAAGAFSLVLECVPAGLAAEITGRLAIPTIGIGAGPRCGGQVLVYHDLLGLEERIAPRFVRRYAELGKLSREGIERFAADVRGGRFPAAEESYGGVPGPATAGAAAAGAATAAAAAPETPAAPEVPETPEDTGEALRKLYG
jgi:3-methyl-2-oxobutanoate hydroxymethyltransferase